ncbi:MAG: UTP--glucose-1-phosphate uridylyltransferase [Clostridiales bacterium]|jgi:UTP--glucose-1-phosphate uridylyltransferase|nr:UTP--glucose-1-phosphate uridylyltransferase [Clostridiales bacterium]
MSKNAAIKKAIILAGGLGTRFLPVTKALPKEMLPIVNKPALQYIVAEAEQSGVERLGILISGGKEAVRRYFTPDPKLEAVLEKSGKTEFLKAVRGISKIDIEFLIQNEPLGSGHAVLCCEGFIGKDDFALLNGDDVVFSETPAIRQIMECFDRCGRTVVGVQPVPRAQIGKYGVVRIVQSDGRAHIIDKIIEKPAEHEICSSLASLGRYAFRNDILDVLRRVKPAANGEIQLPDAINIQAGQDKAAAFEFTGRRYDLGSKAGYIEANIEYALRDPEIGHGIADFIKTL